MSSAPSSKFFLILILGALTTVSPLAIDMYLAAFPQIAASLHSSPSRVALSLSSYFIGLSIGQLFYGPLLDRFGRKPPLYFGLMLFILASVGCLRAQSVEELIAFRLLQALGGCAAQVAATAMVRDFFPVKEAAKVFSLLMLILSVSPLLAPTLGSLISIHFGWRAIFVLLLILVLVLLLVTFFLLPDGQTADTSVSLRFKPIALAYAAVAWEPQFFRYAFSGALSFSGLFVYLAASPIIFMGIFKVSAQTYGAIFALLATGFIGAGQVNIFASRHFDIQSIYRFALKAQLGVGLLFFLCSAAGWLGFYSTVFLLFVYMSTFGFLNPNGTALALAPFSKNAGSASAMLGFLQIGAGALASTGIGFFATPGILAVAAIFTFTSILANLIFLFGNRRMAFSL
jgi:DHA1 family bicyclomycin/chloramphenicol resistance-like MFS transporter